MSKPATQSEMEQERRLHQEVREDGARVCESCGDAWPCVAGRALDELMARRSHDRGGDRRSLPRSIAKVHKRVLLWMAQHDMLRVVLEAVAGSSLTWAAWQWDEKAGGVMFALVLLNWAYTPGGSSRR